MYAHAKGFVDVDNVDIDAAGNLRAWGQCKCMDLGKSGVAAVRHGAFVTEACRTPCHAVGRKSFLSRFLLAATYWVCSGRVQVAGAAWSATLWVCMRLSAVLSRLPWRLHAVGGAWAEMVCVGFLVGFGPHRLERRRKNVTCAAAWLASHSASNGTPSQRVCAVGIVLCPTHVALSILHFLGCGRGHGSWLRLEFSIAHRAFRRGIVRSFECRRKRGLPRPQFLGTP